MKNSYSTLFAIVALVGLFTAGRVEAAPVSHEALRNQHNAIQSQHNAQQTQHTDLQNQYTDLRNQLNAIKSRLDQILPAWSQNLPAADRFVLVLGGAAVLDRETGLVWERSPDTIRRDWFAAQGFCNDRSVGNRKGWGLPTIQQLASLVDPTTPGGGSDLPLGHPFITVGSFYWSATTSANDTSRAWSIFLTNLDVDVDFGKAVTNFVWCVRGGHGGPDAQ